MISSLEKFNSSEIYKEVIFECYEYRKLWTVKEAERILINTLSCEVSTKIHESLDEEFFPYGVGGSYVEFATHGMQDWNQEKILRAARLIEDLSTCELSVFTAGSMKIQIYKTPPREDLYIIAPDILHEMLEREKQEWEATKGMSMSESYDPPEHIDRKDMREFSSMKETMLSQDEINCLLSGTPIDINEPERKKTKLFRWHVRKIENKGEKYFAAEGNVVDHPFCINSERVVTKPLIRADYEEGSEEVLLYTKETEYHCLISECTFHSGATCEYIPELRKYEQNKKQLNTTDPPNDMQDESILIILSDHYEYYFDSAFVKHNGICERTAMDVHFGMSIDTCLIRGTIQDGEVGDGNSNIIFIYYKPHSYHLESYVWEVAWFNVYFENMGEYTIYFTTPEGIIEVAPGKRVLVKRENAVAELDIPLHLDKGKLYWISGGAAD